MAESDPSIPSSSAPASIGRFEVVRALGKGSMGQVYLAKDPRIERLIALKIVKLEGSPEEVEDRKRRLLLEAKAAGRLIHPQIVTLFEADEEAGILFLAFEHVAGSDLAVRLREGPPLSLSEALRITREAAEGLDYAHSQGVIHRDIKPANLLLDARGRVKIGDFGIAKLADQSTDMTHSGWVVGSPHYFAPEQVRGEKLDGRADLFGLGVVLYEILSRRRPFEGDTLSTLIFQILNAPPPPLPLSGLAALLPLERLLQRLLAKDRSERYATAGELVAALAELDRSLPADLLARPLPAVVPEPGGAADPAAPTMALPATGSSPSAAAGPPASFPASPVRRRSRLSLLAVAGVVAVLVAVWLVPRDRPGPMPPAEEAPSLAPKAAPPSEPAAAPGEEQAQAGPPPSEPSAEKEAEPRREGVRKAETVGPAAPAATTASERQTVLVEVSEAIAFRVEPRAARVLVDGTDRGWVGLYGGLGRGWLRLAPGRYRISLVAPGHRPVEFEVEVAQGAKERRRRIEVRLAKE